MVDLKTKYLGLELKNPLVSSASALSKKLSNIKKMEDAGLAGVVLYSLFEEEILLNVKHQLNEAEKNPMIYSGLSETLDYIDLHIKEDTLGNYLNLIREAKNAVSIPVIGSINCVSYEDWIYFTKKIEDAGADALELNIFLHPADFESKEFERIYFEIIEKVTTGISIPVSIKISKYFTRMGLSVKALSETGVSGIVMFNRFFTPDIDIDKMALNSGKLFTTSEDQSETLRWIAIMSGKVNCDLAASTGIHTGEDVVKMLLAGAAAVQVASTLYKNGPDQIVRILKKLEEWMDTKEFHSISQFQGKVAVDYDNEPAAFERMQFMKNFSEIK